MWNFTVPVDGSSDAWRAVAVAVALAQQCHGRLEIIQVVFDPKEAPEAERSLRARLDTTDLVDVDAVPIVRVAAGENASVASEISDAADSEPGTTVVMASQGRGRSAAVVGSVAEELLRRLEAPVVVVGPNSGIPDFANPMVVTVDGSVFSQAALPIAASWSNHLGPRPTLLRVIDDPDLPSANDSDSEEYMASMSALLSTLSKHEVRTTLRHDPDVGATVALHAREIGASLVVASTHGRTGVARFVIGSAAAAIVRCAPCPVLLVRPAHATATEALPRR